MRVSNDQCRGSIYLYAGLRSMPRRSFGNTLATVHSRSCEIEGAVASWVFALMMGVSYTDQKAGSKASLQTWK